MKRWIAMLLALTLLLGLAVPAMAETTIVNANGIQMRVLSCDRGGDVYPMLTMNVRVINDTDDKLWIEFKDSTVDGAPVNSAGRSIDAHDDTGDDDPKFYSFAAAADDDATREVIRTAHTLKTTVVVKGYDTYQEIFRQELTLDIDAMSSQSTSGSDSSDDNVDFGHGGANSASYAPAYTPASYDFKTLQKGSKGQAVKDLQQRLTDLGYLNDKVDGSFGLNTATAVMSFNAQNGFYINGTATPEMQSLLYSSSAQYYIEPWIPLIIGPEYKWDNPTSSNDIGWFYVQLVNRTPDRTVRGYELYYYMTDVWGNKITVGSNNAWLYPITHQQTIKPGYLMYDKAGFAVTPFAYTYSVYVGIHKIVFDDGEIREVSDDEVQYFECPVKK